MTSTRGDWHPVERARAHELVVQQIERQLATGALRVGDKLPPERDLAALVGVSRTAVREAFRVLETQGVLSSSVGADGGTVVRALPREAIARLLRLHVFLGGFPMSDVTETRILLERGAARLAARNATPEQVAALREVVARMAEPGLGPDEFNDLDTELHVRIAEAGDNRLVTDLATAIRESVRFAILRSFEEGGFPRLVENLRAQHEKLVDAIAAHDEDAAERLVDTHIRCAFADLRLERPAD